MEEPKEGKVNQKGVMKREEEKNERGGMAILHCIPSYSY